MADSRRPRSDLIETSLRAAWMRLERALTCGPDLHHDVAPVPIPAAALLPPWTPQPELMMFSAGRVVDVLRGECEAVGLAVDALRCLCRAGQPLPPWVSAHGARLIVVRYAWLSVVHDYAGCVAGAMRAWHGDLDERTHRQVPRDAEIDRCLADAAAAYRRYARGRVEVCPRCLDLAHQDACWTQTTISAPPRLRLLIGGRDG